MPESPVQTFERELQERAGRPIAASQPSEVNAVWPFTGVEVATAREAVPRGSLRRVWRERRANRATPLLLVAAADGVPDRVSVVGPTENAPRDVDAAALAAEIARLCNETQHRASSALEEVIARLSSEAMPDVQVRGLLTNHYVRSRLPRHKAPLCERLAAAANPARGRGVWDKALQALGYSLIERADGYEARTGLRTLALVHVKRDPEEFARMDERGRLPEGVLIATCQAEGIPWGMIASGSRVRLFEARTDRGAATDRWIDLDLATLPEEHQLLVGLFSPAALDTDGIWREMIADARDFGAELKERLDEQIRRFVLPAIARGLGSWVKQRQHPELNDPPVRHEIQQATYTLLFRLLFLLYAESSGHLPYGRSTSYTHNAVYTLCRDARETKRWGGHTL